MKSGPYAKLFEPFQLKHLTLKNRIVKAAYSSTNSDERGYITDSAVPHYDVVARGGVGLFITESVAVHKLGVSGSPRMAIWDDSYIPGQKALADAVHKYGTPILMQLQHAGPNHSVGKYGGWYVEDTEKTEPMSSSTLEPNQLPGPRGNLPRGLSTAEIQEMVETFTVAAERAAAAGYDGVQVHGAAGYLVNSFFSRAWNKRTDEYGGSVENRARFACEIVRRIRQRLGEKFIISVRYNGAEWGARHDDGLTFEEARRIGQLLEQAGTDLLDITVYGYNHAEWVIFPEQMLFPEAPSWAAKFAKDVQREVPLVESAAFVKAGVSVPVVTVGKLSFETGEQVLREGKADLVAYARALISDPDAPNKLREGRVKEIRPCTHCLTCLDAFARSEHERCRVNAAFAVERELELTPATTKRHILVIGGGPGGMEAARVAAERGHRVTLCEKQSSLGGLVPLASIIKGTDIEDLPSFIEYLQNEIERLDVNVHRSVNVDTNYVRELNPDAVIIATGSKLQTPEIPGMQGSKLVVTGPELLEKIKLPRRILGTSLLEKATKLWLPVGKRVFIVGGMMQGAELAEFLVKRGREVILSDTSEPLGLGVLEIHRTRLLDWLSEKGTVLLPSVTYDRVTDQGVSLTTKEGERRVISADTVVVLANREPDFSLRDEIGAFVAEVHVIGDCNTPGMIVDAVASGYRAGMVV